MRALPLVMAATLVAAGLLAGCLAAEVPVEVSALAAAGAPRLPLTDWYNVTGEPNTRGTQSGGAPFHTLEEIEAKIQAWNATHPGLVDVSVVGSSIEGRPIWQVVVSNESRATGPDGGPKLAPLLDAGHHANELAGIEQALFVVDYLLDNHGRNATITAIVDDLEVHVVPLVNPDGYVRQTRGNALGVNLNRNYDIDWGNPLGASNLVMGTLAHATNRSMPSVAIVAENSGSEAFSEPETQAMRDLQASLGARMAFYMTMHTPTNGFIGPWSAYDHPPLPAEDHAVIESVLEWVRTHTEYEAGKAEWANFSAGLPYAASGTSMDWAYSQHHVPAFTLEIEIWYTSVTSGDYAGRGGGMVLPYDGLAYWMAASLPVPMYLLANAAALKAWGQPTAEPPLPEGVPPLLPADRVKVDEPWHV